MSLGPYASFIVTSYLVVTAVVLMLIVWIAVDYRRQKRRLRELEAERHQPALRTQRGGHPMSEPITSAPIPADAPPPRRSWIRPG